MQLALDDGQGFIFLWRYMRPRYSPMTASSSALMPREPRMSTVRVVNPAGARNPTVK